ncbi:LPS-assembly protein LptD [Rariglobus hedericola]|uniref:LPS-assembly protein LptD n=1 Tax=Rariglobus hedericola TaxID=2597822 RepID=A0A556QQ66_9BACT|nr:LPS assembly protein LptD [Rariglobus hedericola]TSJ78771.1 LPS-assembly protein LptD [Rariglobus hedericola]
MTRRLLPVLLLASAPLLNGASPALPEITATRTEITDAGTVFNGDARLNYDGALLLADQISYDPKTQVARATGHVSLTRGPQRLLADELIYNLETRSYSVKDMRVGQDPIYISGSSLEGTPDKVVIEDAVITFSDPGLATPTVRASSVTYIPSDSITAKSARVGVGPVMPIPVPLYSQTINDPLLSHVKARAGFSSNLGGELDLGLLAPFTRTVKLGGDLGIYTKRGVMFGPAGAYAFDNANQSFHGSLRSGYISDSGDRGNDILLKPIPKERGFVSWEHYQTVGDDVTLLGQVNYWSDSDVLRDFREREFRDVQTPDNFFEGYKTGDNYVVSAFTRFQPNDYHVVQRRLPEIRFDGLPVDAGAGIYHRVNASIASLEDKSLPALSDPVNRVDTYYALTRPFTPREWLSIKPVAGARFTYYDRALGGKSDYTRVLGEIGFDADLQASSTYDYKNERWDIDGIRHVVKPYVSYRAIGNADQGQAYIPPIDRDAFSTYLQPLGLGDRRDIDTLDKTNTLRLGLDNAIQTRDRVYGSRNLAELNVATDWRFDRAANQSHFSAIQTEAALTPVNWLRFDVYSNITPSDLTMREINTGVTFRDAGVWSARVSTDFLRSDPAAGVVGIQEYNLDVRYTLNEAYQLLFQLSYDTRLGSFSQQTFGLRQNIRNIWFIDYVLSLREGNSRAGSTSFSVSIELASF